MRKRGFALIFVLLLVVLLSILGFFLVDFVIADFKLSGSLKKSFEALYIAQAGVEEVVWQLKNNPAYRAEFESGIINRSLQRNNIWDGNASYEVQITALSPGQVGVTSKGYYQVGLYPAKRVIKAKLVRALNPNPIDGLCAFGGNDIDVIISEVDINGGSIYARDDVSVIGLSTVNVTHDVLARDQITTGPFSQLNVGGLKRSSNYPPPPSEINLPSVNFDYYRGVAQAAGTLYSQTQFKNMLQNNPNLTLNGTIYVTGNVDIKKQQSLTVNGILVADGSISVGSVNLWPPTGTASLFINPPTDGGPSGLLSKQNIRIDLNVGDTNFNGLVYANNQIQFYNWRSSVPITGGLIGRDITVANLWQKLTVNYNLERVRQGISPGEAPTVRVEYWEEEY